MNPLNNFVVKTKQIKALRLVIGLCDLLHVGPKLSTLSSSAAPPTTKPQQQVVLFAVSEQIYFHRRSFCFLDLHRLRLPINLLLPGKQPLLQSSSFTIPCHVVSKRNFSSFKGSTIESFNLF
ncbi:unnamed protein product [Brassica oleracea var. botrytis]